MSRVLSSLSLRELTLFVSIARRQSLSVSASLSGGLGIRPNQFSLSDILDDFARLSVSVSLSSSSTSSSERDRERDRERPEEKRERLSLLCLPLLQSLLRLSLVSVWPPVSSLSSSLSVSRPQPLSASSLSVSLLSQYLVTCEHSAREIAGAFSLSPSVSVSTNNSPLSVLFSQTGTIKMPQRLRQAVLHPSLSLSDHTSSALSTSEHPRGGVETLHSLSLNTERLRELRERQRERHEEEERERNRPRLHRQRETETETERQTETETVIEMQTHRDTETEMEIERDM